jgi:DNA-binding NarL/FixJ family response regulator
MSAKIGVLIVDDHARMRAGIRRLLERHPSVRIVGEASNGVEAVQYARTLRPRVVIMDISMPYMDGVQATRLIKQEQPSMVIIGLSMIDAAAMRQAMLRAGAAAYVNKANAADDLDRVISEHVDTPLGIAPNRQNFSSDSGTARMGGQRSLM